MRTTLVGMGLWMRWVILGVLHPIGMVHATCGLIRLLYRASPALARRPIWTAVITHLLVFLALLTAAAAVLWKLGRAVCG
jgi:hypothetical protein